MAAEDAATEKLGVNFGWELKIEIEECDGVGEGQKGLIALYDLELGCAAGTHVEFDGG